MRWLGLIGVLWGLLAFADDTPQMLVTGACAPGATTCNPSKSDLKDAKSAFGRALKLEKSKRLDEAYQEFDTAARLAPNNVSYVTALAITREQLIYKHLQRGNADLNNGHEIEAQAEFREAVTLDPGNKFAQQRFLESLGQWAPPSTPALRSTEDGGELRAEPTPIRQAFHFRGDSKQLLAEVAKAYGISAEVDDSVASRRVHFDLEESGFTAAMQAACDVTGTFWTGLSDNQILLARDTTENHRLYDRLFLRTYYLNLPSPQAVSEVVSMLRIVFEVRFLQQHPQSGRLVIRAPLPILDAISRELDNFGKAQPQVILDLQIYEIDHQFARDIGVHIPNTFNLFNIPAAALVLASGQNIQSLINQLISGGGINQANSSALSGLLAQLQGQGQGSGIFSQPVATFGGGLTLMGLTLDNLTATLSLNESWVKHLDHATLRAAQGNDMTFRLGQRYPVVNASFAPIFNTAAISQVLQNGSFQAPVPSISYEDLGLDVKAKPTVSGGVHVGLDLEIKLRALAGQSVNGVPVIANREYKGSINLEDGEPAVVASSLTHSEQITLMGIPGVNSIPLLNKVATTNNKTAEDDEILLVITPHVMNLGAKENSELWLPR